ncbi:TBCD [Symbiodinium pilosum]|uniref:TBCD protein n=1 Tax=Symbiodinium pilosum TaxID=2952 RepID=A0A812TVC1_SYMPI|nr:TBCD [Symbiodinium pilosum]
MTLGAETPLVEAAKLMAEQAGGKFSCHHLLVQVASGQQDASGRPLKARLLSALDIANGMIEAAKSSVAAERALALSVRHVMKPRTSVPTCASSQSVLEAFRLLSGSQQNCVLVTGEKDEEASEEDNVNEDSTRGAARSSCQLINAFGLSLRSASNDVSPVPIEVVTPVDALLAFSEKITGEKRILRDWVRGVNVDESTSLASAASMMACTGQHHLLVVLGVVSALDIVRALSHRVNHDAGNQYDFPRLKQSFCQGASVYDPIYAYGLAVHQVESNTISLDSYLFNIWFQLPQQSVRCAAAAAPGAGRKQIKVDRRIHFRAVLGRCKRVRYLQTVDECARHTTEAIRVVAAEALGVLATARFKPELCSKCVDTYLKGLQKADETIAARRGFALCLGAMPMSTLAERRADVLTALCKEVQAVGLPGGKDQEDPTTRQYAVLSLGSLCVGSTLSAEEMSLLLSALQAAMRDYATDRRGDVGSWVREVAMEVIAAILEEQRNQPEPCPALPDAACTTKLVSLLLQQAVEKIDRLRDRAYGLLCSLLCGCQHGLDFAKQRVLHGEAYDALGLAAAAEAASPVPARQAWPPAEVNQLSGCLQPSKTVKSELSEHKPEADRTAVFDALTPLLAVEEYRPSLLLGLVVSVGGITEHTAKEAKKALLRHLTSENTQRQVCQELLHIFDLAGLKDAAAEAKRLLAPLLNTMGILLAQDCVPREFARDVFDRTVRAVRTSRDIGRLRASVAVFIGLMKWPGALRRDALGLLLQFLGYSFPTVRQATAQALYIRLLEEEGDLDLSTEASELEAGYAVPKSEHSEVQGAIVKADDVAEVLELVSTTPWATDEEATLGKALTEVYAKLRVELPTSGRSILAPKKPKEEQPREAHYADLVRENHY